MEDKKELILETIANKESRRDELLALDQKELSPELQAELMEIVSELQEIQTELMELITGEDSDEEGEKSEETNLVPAGDKSLKAKLDAIIKAKNIENFTATEDGNLVSSMKVAMPKASGDKTQEDYMPTDKELAIINAEHTLIKYEKEQIRVFSFQAADTLIDRSYEQFSPKALNKMADLAVKGKIPFLTEGDHDHQTRQKNVRGAVFAANVDEGGLVYKVFIPVIGLTKNTLEAIFSGLYSKLSVGFSINAKDYICNECKESMYLSDCPHYPGESLGKGKVAIATIDDVKANYEISGVAVPCQPLAHIRQGKSLLELGVGAEPSEALEKAIEAGSAFESAIKDFSSALKTEEISPVDTMNIGTGTAKDLVMEDNKSTETEKVEDVKDAEDTSDVSTKEVSGDAPDTKETLDVEALKTSLVDAVKEVKQEVEVKVDATEITELVKSLSEKMDAVKEAIEKMASLEEKITELTVKVDAATSVSTDAVSKAMLASAAEVKQESKGLLMDLFGNDLGGQK